MAELADAPDLGSGGNPVQVQVLLSALLLKRAPHLLIDQQAWCPLSLRQRIIRNHGVKRILFGSDSPWSDQHESLKMIQKSPLTDEEKALILGGNAKKMLMEWL